MRGFLPPSSRAVRLKVLAAARATSWPALGPPVKETIRTRGSSAIWALRASSATGTTFSTPAMNRYTSGRFVSPVALRMPLPQLYSPIPGRPMAYSFRYSTAPGKNSSLVFSSRSIGSAKNTHTRHTSTPRPRQIRKDEWTVFSTLSLSSMPSPRAAATFTPAPAPISSPVNRDTSVVVEPTAPSAI